MSEAWENRLLTLREDSASCRSTSMRRLLMAIQAVLLRNITVFNSSATSYRTFFNAINSQKTPESRLGLESYWWLDLHGIIFSLGARAVQKAIQFRSLVLPSADAFYFQTKPTKIQARTLVNEVSLSTRIWNL